jgi:hypothetical protein
MSGGQLGTGLVLFGVAGALLSWGATHPVVHQGVRKVEAGIWFWVVVLSVVGVIVLSAHSDTPEPVRPAYPVYQVPGHGGYENPAPGDDGTADCPPGGGPVYVGSNDPNNLDHDGDGWGCE